MPATVTHIRLPDSNRVPVSSTLRTHAIWRDSVGYDPYAPQAQNDAGAAGKGAPLLDKGNELLVLARLTGNVATRTPGACPKCKQVGHLAFQCRNLLSTSEDLPDAGEDAFQRVKQREEEEDDQRVRAALGIASDSDEEAVDHRQRWGEGSSGKTKRLRPRGAETPRRKKRKTTRCSSSSDSDSSSSSSSRSSSSSSGSASSSEDERCNKKKKNRRRTVKKKSAAGSGRAKK